MKHIITLNSRKETTFYNIEPGQIFRLNDRWYMKILKIDMLRNYNAINLYNAILDTIPIDTIVKPYSIAIRSEGTEE